jgi:hypothetical protein
MRKFIEEGTEKSKRDLSTGQLAARIIQPALCFDFPSSEERAVHDLVAEVRGLKWSQVIGCGSIPTLSMKSSFFEVALSRRPWAAGLLGPPFTLLIRAGYDESRPLCALC